MVGSQSVVCVTPQSGVCFSCGGGVEGRSQGLGVGEETVGGEAEVVMSGQGGVQGCTG